MIGIWDSVMQLFVENNINIHIYGTFLWSFLIYWIIGFSYTAIDLIRGPKSIYKYKINKSYKVTSKDVYKTMKNVLLNQILIQFALSLISLPILRRHEYSVSRQDFSPNYWRILIHLLICVVIEEMGFYYSHRLLHLNKFYKYIHSKHHHWTVPTAIAASYCHPIEHIISNVLPIYLGPMLLNSHLAFLWLWIAIATITSLHTHSGFHLPLGLSPQFHNYHHSHFNQNFGVLGIMDKIHKTDKLFRKSKESQRHKWLLTTKPSQEVFQ
ncbi:unnamed protein product, partial [Medioppia subpectinata]